MKKLIFLGSMLFICAGAFAQNSSEPKKIEKESTKTTERPPLILDDSTMVDGAIAEELASVLVELLYKTSDAMKVVDFDGKLSELKKDMSTALQMIVDPELMQRLENIEMEFEKNMPERIEKSEDTPVQKTEYKKI